MTSPASRMVVIGDYLVPVPGGLLVIDKRCRRAGHCEDHYELQVICHRADLGEIATTDIETLQSKAHPGRPSRDLAGQAE